MNDELLDQVIARLRNEPVPEMPGELTLAPPLAARRWKRHASIVSGLAASLLIATWWRWSAEQGPEQQGPGAPAPAVVQRAETDPREPLVVVRTIDLAEPLTRLEAKLTAIDAEIVALRRRAALLDARRKAEELVAHYQAGAAIN